MANKGVAGIVAPFAVVTLMIYATQIYAEHQAYKTGVYMGKMFFHTEDLKNRSCLSVPVSSNCEVHDLNRESVMESALASAQIIPALRDSTALPRGFREGWRDARTASSRQR